MKRVVVAAVLCCLLSPVLFAKRRAVAPAPPPNETRFGQPLPGLPPSLVALFDAGRAEFDRRQTIADGLGPVLNGASCSECHSLGAVGGGSTNVVTRVGAMTKGVFDPLVKHGGPVLQVRWIGAREGAPHEFRGEKVPLEASIVVHRRTTSLFGLGLVDATPDATFIALAAEQAARNDGTAGRVSMVDNLAAGMQTVGKFGWKAQNPTLFQFAGEAYLNEIGITNPFFAAENCPRGRCEDLRFNPYPGLNDDGSGTKALTDFMTLLAPPARGPVTEAVLAGEAVFIRIGCEACHAQTLQTGAHENPALDRVTYHPYSDFLLHDMGSLGDGFPQGTTARREMRTAPLWGLRLIPGSIFPAFLHDGRARTIEAAIDAHDGQGKASRDRFTALGDEERAQLLAFLKSL
jgi:CxxC motif-containing protein (DUF1111 family)